MGFFIELSFSLHNTNFTDVKNKIIDKNKKKLIVMRSRKPEASTVCTTLMLAGGKHCLYYAHASRSGSRRPALTWALGYLGEYWVQHKNFPCQSPNGSELDEHQGWPVLCAR